MKEAFKSEQRGGAVTDVLFLLLAIMGAAALVTDVVMDPESSGLLTPIGAILGSVGAGGFAVSNRNR